MAQFNVSFNVVYVTGPRTGQSGTRPLPFLLGVGQGVESEADAVAWCEFLYVGGSLQVEGQPESYRVVSASISAV